ncbi:MAG: pilus (MSHA type) biogenesis protein MshL [Nitrospirae bacterium]|nr:MAG: pilus (MSHA type) biogenesis protein MshL [Nitrospirota bacterium]
MAEDRTIEKSETGSRNLSVKGIFFLAFFSLPASLLILSCASPDIEKKSGITEAAKEIKTEKPPAPEFKMPEFIPLSEDISSLKTKIVDISARNTPMKDVLHVISESAGINIVMEKGVDAETPITLTLKNISAKDALDTIISSVDYFYTIRENMLFVKAMDTKIFELGHPSIVQNYNIDVGGDILGGGTGIGTGTTAGTGTTGTALTTPGAASIRGSVTQTSKSDSAAFNFWDVIEKNISSILGITAIQAGAASPAVQQSFTVNRLTGTIVVTASKKNIERAEQYINTVKTVINRQVMIEARITEVQLTEGLKYGIDWSLLDRGKGGDTVKLQTRSFSDVVSQTLPAFSIGVTSSNFTSLLNALEQQGEVKTLSNPRINIMNGQTALLSVGRNVTIISQVQTSTTTASGATPTTTFTIGTSSILSGIIIGIVPYINENGEISMTITPIISDLVSLEARTVGQAGNQTQISLPTIDLKELSTTVKVGDGQMIIIGGLISKKESFADNKIPILGDVPVVGALFKSRDKQESRTELVIALQPALISR